MGAMFELSLEIENMTARSWYTSLDSSPLRVTASSLVGDGKIFTMPLKYYLVRELEP